MYDFAQSKHVQLSMSNNSGLYRLALDHDRNPVSWNILAHVEREFFNKVLLTELISSRVIF